MTSRLELLHKNYVVFRLTQGPTSQTSIKDDIDVTLDVEVVNENSSEAKIKIDVENHSWHQNLLGLTESSSILLYGETKYFQDICGITEKFVFIKLTILKVMKAAKTVTKVEEDNSRSTTKKYLTKVGKAVMPEVYENQRFEKQLEIEISSESSENDVKLDTEAENGIKTKFEKQPSKIQVEPEPKVQTEIHPKTAQIEARPEKVQTEFKNGDLLNMIMTENRLQNTELRLTVMKMNEKLDSILDEQRKSSSTKDQQNSNSNDEVVKRAMNRMFKQLKSVIEPNETYSGQEVIKLVANCVKNSIE